MMTPSIPFAYIAHSLGIEPDVASAIEARIVHELRLGASVHIDGLGALTTRRTKARVIKATPKGDGNAHAPARIVPVVHQTAKERKAWVDRD